MNTPLIKGWRRTLCFFVKNGLLEGCTNVVYSAGIKKPARGGLG